MAIEEAGRLTVRVAFWEDEEAAEEFDVVLLIGPREGTVRDGCGLLGDESAAVILAEGGIFGAALIFCDSLLMIFSKGPGCKEGVKSSLLPIASLLVKLPLLEILSMLPLLLGFPLAEAINDPFMASFRLRGVF